jgi:hypothetical protein
MNSALAHLGASIRMRGIEAFEVVRADLQMPIQIEGPLRVEPTEIPAEVLATTPDVRWLVRVQLAGSSDSQDLELARQMARELARTHEGAVYDPQVISTDREPLDSKAVLRLEWFTAHRNWDSQSCATTLKVLGGAFPSALPCRYGAAEPLQGRFDLDGAAAFCRAWNHASRDVAGTFFWSSKRPFLEGAAVTSPDSTRRGLIPIGKLQLLVEADQLEPAPISELFTRMAEAHRCFYAAGFLDPAAEVRRGKVWFRPDADGLILSQRGWAGLPNASTWLTWYGHPYVELVRPYLQSTPIEFEGGALVVADERPIAPGPRLVPAELVARTDDQLLLPADVIPDL